MLSPKALLARARDQSPLLDHLVRALSRYQADQGDRLAAAVTFYWFLSLFPLLLLAVAVLGVVYDNPGKDLSVELAAVLPTEVASALEEVITSNTGRTGLVGVAGLLLAGLGWVQALRQAIRTMWHQSLLDANLVVQKLLDVVVLVGLFATLAASVVFTGLVTAFTDTALGIIGLDTDATAPQVATRALGYAVALIVDTGVFLYLLTGLVGIRSPIRSILPAAVFGAVGFEVLKVLGGLYVERTTSRGQATYGAFAVVIGLLLFLNLVSRLIMLTAAFAVTSPDDARSVGADATMSPPPPSGADTVGGEVDHGEADLDGDDGDGDGDGQGHDERGPRTPSPVGRPVPSAVPSAVPSTVSRAVASAGVGAVVATALSVAGLLVVRLATRVIARGRR